MNYYIDFFKYGLMHMKQNILINFRFENKDHTLIEQCFSSDFRKYVSSKSLSRISLRGWPRPRRSRAAGRIQMTPTKQRNCSSNCRNLANGWYLFRGTSRMRTIRRASSRQAASSFLTLYWRNSKI